MPDVPLLSAHALRSWEECPFQFALSRIHHRHWPAPRPASSEAKALLGQEFHRLVERRALGLPDEGASLFDPALQALWSAFCASPHANPTGQVYTEQPLNYMFEALPVTVRYDRLIAFPDGRWTLYDWKTGDAWVAGRIKAQEIRSNWQTRLYMFSLVHVGHQAFGCEPIAPERVSMIYWAGCDRLDFTYSEAQYQVDRQQLSAVVEQIQGSRFPKNPSSCRRCQFDTYCNSTYSKPQDSMTSPPLPRFQHDLPEV